MKVYTIAYEYDNMIDWIPSARYAVVIAESEEAAIESLKASCKANLGKVTYVTEHALVAGVVDKFSSR